jgi:Uma2 family endonuclease
VVVEVLSPGTEEYDRGDKLAYYRSIPSVLEVVLVAHDRARIGQVARLESIDCDIMVDDVFRDPLA